LAGTSCIRIIDIALGGSSLNASPRSDSYFGALIRPGSNRVGSPTARGIGRKDGDGRPEDRKEFLESL